jgi:hypothetical protein
MTYFEPPVRGAGRVGATVTNRNGSRRYRKGALNGAYNRSFGPETSFLVTNEERSLMVGRGMDIRQPQQKVTEFRDARDGEVV